LEIIFNKFLKNDCSCPNLALCCEINAHMNDIIVQQNVILICKTFIYTISTKGLKSTTFNDKIFMKFYTYIKETIKKIFPSKFSIFLKVMNLNKMI
jgi:hypothetical protein